MKKIIKEYKEQIRYFLENKTYMTILIIVAILSYGFTITHFAIGVDDLCFDRYVTGTYILSAKRWGTWALYNILNIKSFSPFWLEFIVTIFMMLIAIVICSFLRKNLGDKLKKETYLITSSILISNPISYYFYIYESTNLALAISNLLVIIFGIIIFENYFNGKNKRTINLICGVLLSVPISMYESCAQTFMVFLFLAVFIKLLDKKSNTKNLIKYFILNIILLAIGILFYYLIGKLIIMYLEKNKMLQKSFANQKIIWNFSSFKSLPFLGKIIYLLKVIGEIPDTEPVAYFELMILSLILIISEFIIAFKENKVFRLLMALGLVTVNFALIILQGTVMLRTEFSWILSSSLISAYIYESLSNKKVLKIISIIVFIWLIIIQTHTINNLFYKEYKRYEYEKQVANDIGLSITKNNDYKTKPVIFINLEQKNNDKGLVFKWGMTSFLEYGTEITKFINNFGYNLINGSLAEHREAVSEYKNLSIEERKQTIIETNKYIIVNLENYDIENVNLD